MESPLEIRTNCDVPSLWLEHKTELRNFILKRVRDPELANDILQEVLLKVYNFCMSKSGVKNVRSWLFQIAQNTLIDNYRKQSRLSFQENLPEVLVEDENMAFADALHYISPMLNFLPPEYAIPLKLSDIDGLKQSDIADQLQLSLSATKSRIQRARQLLKAEFITCCHIETDANGNIISFDIKDDCKPLQKIKQNLSN
jgi:RNA polymerase sigma-70 factor (ECF subfamily)